MVRTASPTSSEASRSTWRRSIGEAPCRCAIGIRRESGGNAQAPQSLTVKELLDTRSRSGLRAGQSGPLINMESTMLGWALTFLIVAIIAGLPYTTLRDVIFAHPTMAEGLISLLANVPLAAK